VFDDVVDLEEAVVDYYGVVSCLWAKAEALADVEEV
jgi:hypothetical protein